MYSRILVPIDGSETAERGLAEAVELAAQLKSQIVLLTVVDDYPILVEMASMAAFEEIRHQRVKFGEGILDLARRRIVEAGVPCEVVLREVAAQRAATTIVDVALEQKCSLIVMGTHGRRGLNRLAMGSDAEWVVREASVPVLLVRAQVG